MLFRRFKDDRRGVSAIEFSFIAPVLIIIYFSTADLCECMLAQRKVSHAASAVGDLVTQVSSVTPSSLSDIYSAATSIVAPFSATPLQIRVTSVSADANDNTTVAWSNASGMTALTAGAPVALPANLLPASQTIIMAEVKYSYVSPINYIFNAPVNFDQIYYLRPRLTQSVTCTGC